VSSPPPAVAQLRLVRPMKSWFGWTLFILAIAGVADGFYAYRWYFSRDGSSLHRAIVIPQSELQLQDEFAWVGEHHNGPMFPVEQTLVCDDGRLYERWTFGTAPTQENLYFDLGRRKDICGPWSESELDARK
jgi:hypothetical protein